jgi:Mrp family chromosome partitioning ATPase
MALLNRTLTKAYGRRRPTPPAPEPQLESVSTARGWIDLLREPIQPATIAEEDQIAAWHWPILCDTLLAKTGAGFRALAEQLLQTARSHRRAIALLSAQREAGCTSILLTLAHVLAETPTRVLLIDADFARPALAQRLGLQPECGLWDVLRESAALETALLPLIRDKLMLLPLACPVDHADVRKAAGDAFTRLMDRLRDSYDLILIDAGEWMETPAPLVWNHRVVNAAICISREGALTERELDREASACRDGGIEFLGVVETFAAAHPAD